MVKFGFMRAFGTSLRRVISIGLGNRFSAFASGAFVTALLQSSTATAIILISFMKKQAVPLYIALAAIIGADVSTTFVAHILTFDLSFLSPAFLIIGIIGHMTYEHGGRKRHIFRLMIGLGFILLALAQLREASAPLETSETLPLVLAPLERDPVVAILFSMLLTWVIHSSLASVLLFASLASNTVIDLQLGMLLVLGANIGGALVPFTATFSEGHMARRITVGNFAMRGLTLLLVFPFLSHGLAFLSTHNIPPAHQIVYSHMAFNVLLALIFLPTVSFIAPLFEKLIIPRDKEFKGEGEPHYLDKKALDTPVIALASAARETLRMAEMVEKMLDQTILIFEHDDDALANTIRKQDNYVDSLYGHIKLYMARVTQEALDPKEADRYLQILTFATNLEHIGDIIDKSLIELAKKKIRKQDKFSKEGWEEIKAFHARIMENMRLAQTIFLSEDPELAHELVAGKRDIRLAERATSAHHFERLRTGLPETIATSSLHLDIIRDYRRINSYITGIAYAILENSENYSRQNGKVRDPQTRQDRSS